MNVFTPLVVGKLGEALGLGRMVSYTAAAPFMAAALVWMLLPETAKRALEETSRL